MGLAKERVTVDLISNFHTINGSTGADCLSLLVYLQDWFYTIKETEGYCNNIDHGREGLHNFDANGGDIIVIGSSFDLYNSRSN